MISKSTNSASYISFVIKTIDVSLIVILAHPKFHFSGTVLQPDLTVLNADSILIWTDTYELTCVQIEITHSVQRFKFTCVHTFGVEIDDIDSPAIKGASLGIGQI